MLIQSIQVLFRYGSLSPPDFDDAVLVQVCIYVMILVGVQPAWNSGDRLLWFDISEQPKR